MDTSTIRLVYAMLFTLFESPKFIQAGCSNLDYPDEFVNCGTDAGKDTEYSLTGESVLDFCTQKYLWETPNQRWHRKIDVQKTQEYFSSIYRQNTEVYEDRGRNKMKKLIKKRKKKPCVRKEIRQMTRLEWKRFIAALNAAKEDKSVDPNVWEYFGSIHTSPETEAAHYGSAFLAWHRIFCLTLEMALQKYDRRVCLPYWDTSFEFLVKDPRKSVVFSEHFLGAQRLDPSYPNGNVGPPFHKWNLTRNIMKAWQRENLIKKSDVEKFLSEKDISQITAGISTHWESVLEFKHNRVHNFIGGHVSKLETAAYDPLFWMLHCYIDYLWELFRINQKKNYIDPETYPVGENSAHHYPDREIKVFGKIAKMLGFKREKNETLYLRNRDGYSNIWTERFYSYAPGSTCNNKCSKSKWLKCFNETCVSKSVSSKGKGKIVFLPLDLKKANRRKKKRLNEKKERDKEESRDNTKFYEEPMFYDEEQPIQHTYYLNGQCDTQQWVYMAVRITMFRPDGIHYQSYPVKNGEIQYGYDIFDSQGYKGHKNDIKLENPASFEYCGTSGAGDTRVYVQTVGKNYFGHFLEYAIVDERYPISHSVAYVGIKEPKDGVDTEVMFSAYDECGRLCKPMCLVEGSSPPMYRHCSGVLRINNRKPLIFHKTLGDAMLYYWEIPSPRSHYSPYSQYKGFCINFLCDSSKKYPWNQDNYGY